jgi:CubicO group peptidase (beta-lactamase class C family)
MKEEEDIEAFVDAEIKRGTFPGIVLLVEKENILRYSLVKGFRQYQPDKEKMTEDTVFDLGSLTKPLATGVVMLQVCEQEGIGLGRKLENFVPEINPASGKITLAQLLLHTGGLPPDPILYKQFPDDQSIDRDHAVARLLAIVPEKPPGTEVIYSCTGYLLLGQFLEKTTNTGLGRLFREMVTDRGRIEDLFFNPPPVVRQRIAATELCSWRKRWIRGEVHDENCFCLGGEAGNAGLFGTAESVLRLLSIFSSEGCLEGVPLLSPVGAKQMMSCLTEGMNGRRSIGFRMQDDDSPVGQNFSRSSFGHTGFPGTSVWIDPEKHLKIVVLTNRIHLGRQSTDWKIKEFRRRIHSAVHRIWG